MNYEYTPHTLHQHPVQPTLHGAPHSSRAFRHFAAALLLLLLLLCPVTLGAAEGASHIERTTTIDALVLTVIPALKAQLATDVKAARATVSALLPQVSAGGPASIALAELALEAERQGLPTLHCEGVTLVYHWSSGQAGASQALDQVEHTTLALGRKLRRQGFPLKGETTGVPWSRIAPLETDPHSPQGARALRVWQTAVGACISVLVEQDGHVQVVRSKEAQGRPGQEAQ